ncbi:MAG: hypothetical protein M3O91_08855 [Chloroflexota bacterium]|nr:hypothetical protein [Chloroflexota bacterium]
MSAQDVAVFPLPADVTPEVRETARREIAKHTEIVGEDEHGIRLSGRQLGKTGPIWHFQYTRIYALPRGFLAAANDLREGVKVAFAERAEDLAASFENPAVRELIEDELRFRKVIA